MVTANAGLSCSLTPGMTEQHWVLNQPVISLAELRRQGHSVDYLRAQRCTNGTSFRWTCLSVCAASNFFENTLSIPDVSPCTRCEAMHAHKSRPSLLASHACTICKCTLNTRWHVLAFLFLYFPYQMLNVVLQFPATCLQYQYRYVSCCVFPSEGNRGQLATPLTSRRDSSCLNPPLSSPNCLLLFTT